MNDPLAEEIVQLRAATPGCAQVIHFNHAGASLPSQATLDAINAQLLREATIGPMEAGVEGARLQEEARHWAARLLGTDSAAIAFTGSGSAAWGTWPSVPWGTGTRATGSWWGGMSGVATWPA